MGSDGKKSIGRLFHILLSRWFIFLLEYVQGDLKSKRLGETKNLVLSLSF
jgi:hypothetical protein